MNFAQYAETKRIEKLLMICRTHRNLKIYHGLIVSDKHNR